MSLLNRFIPSIAQDVSRAFTLLDEPLFNAARRYPSSFPTLSDRLPNFFRPSVDISETDKNYVIEAEVPGMKKEDLSIECLDDGSLIMKGKIETPTAPTEKMRTVDATNNTSTTESGGTTEDVVEAGAETTEPTIWTSERMRGHFQRSFQFPSNINPEDVKATYRDGILKVVIPKLEKHRKQISIE